VDVKQEDIMLGLLTGTLEQLRGQQLWLVMM
jgi:hypothetical protein